VDNGSNGNGFRGMKFHVPSVSSSAWRSPALERMLQPSTVAIIDRMARDMVALRPVIDVKALAAWKPTFDVAALVKASIRIPTIQPALLEALRGIDWEAFERRISTPRNWPSDFERILPMLQVIANDEGIPIAWVPDADILEELASAPDSATRSSLLIERRDDILENCRSATENIEHELITPLMPSVREVFDACASGFWMVGALASVQLTHSIVEALAWPSDRQRVQKFHALTSDVSLRGVMEQATRAPLVQFYEDWHPKSGRPRPVNLSRHVITHRFGPDQVVDRNCVVAVMLLASLVVTVDQLGLASTVAA
jgi:hypothetical protein